MLDIRLKLIKTRTWKKFLISIRTQNILVYYYCKLNDPKIYLNIFPAALDLSSFRKSVGYVSFDIIMYSYESIQKYPYTYACYMYIY
jgi:hypothetical protein